MKKALKEIIEQDLIAAGSKGTSKKDFLKFYLTHPEFKTVFYYRIATYLYNKGGLSKVLGKLLWARMVKISGCYISPKAKIGSGLKLPHATAIVIGDDVVIGNNVQIYQNVTLGRKTNEKDGYPIIEDNAIIYSGSCIIGNITIGESSIIGANSVVTKDVPKNTTAVGIPAKNLS